MKKIIKNPILWIIMVIFLILIVLYYFGFRITYNPHLDNNWNAISACAGWAGVVASFFAILVAIHIPEKIADQQNKIALFEKRYIFYDRLCRCVEFSVADQIQTMEGVKELFCLLLGDDTFDINCEIDDVAFTHLRIEVLVTLEEGKFLFPHYSREINSFREEIKDTLSSMLTPEKFFSQYEQLKISGKRMNDQILPEIEKMLEL